MWIKYNKLKSCRFSCEAHTCKTYNRYSENDCMNCSRIVGGARAGHLTARSKARVYELSFAGIAGSNPAGEAWMSVSCGWRAKKTADAAIRFSQLLFAYQKKACPDL
jgi:hypothetical protein